MFRQPERQRLAVYGKNPHHGCHLETARPEYRGVCRGSDSSSSDQSTCPFSLTRGHLTWRGGLNDYDFYVDWGRDPWDPVLMFKMVFLQFLYDLSDRDIEEQAAFNLVYKWFLGLSTEELPPDHTVLCRFRQRLGPEGFETLFNQVVEQARNRGFITDRLHIIDSTHIIARVDLFRLKKEHRSKDKGY